VHEPSLVVLVVPCLDDLVYVLSKLQNYLVLLISFDLLKLLLALELLDLGPVLCQILPKNIHLVHLLFKLVLKLQKLFFLSLNLGLFRLEGRFHFRCPMSENVL